MFDWLKGWFRPPRESVNKRLLQAHQDLRARYDAAQTSTENNRLWLQTDYLSARSANSYQVRRVLRTRARYEISNNSYARGITLTLANDLIGTGPRLNMRLPDKAANKLIESAFDQWCRAVDLPEKLRTMKLAKTGDGEGFAMFVTNSLIESPVQLDMQLIEADQVTTPDAGFGNANWVDGVVLDALGNVIAYNVLNQHPGDLFMSSLNPIDYRTIPRRSILHWFRRDRPGQVRGIPEITPALELFAKLRRYTQAVIEAAEIAADFAAVLETAAPGNTDTAEPNPFDTAKIERGMMTQLPWNTKLSQFKPEQPTTTYEMFKRAIISEIARCLNVPYNIAAGDSSSYNYSSGRLDHLGYHRQQRVERAQCECILDRIFAAWLDEAIMIPGLIPANVPSVTEIPHRWFWDGLESIDPVKDATARQINLASNLTTLEDEYAELGEEWEPRIRQRGEEIALMVSLGITPEQPKPEHGQGLNEGAGVQDAQPTKAAASYVADMDPDEDGDVNTRTLLQVAQIFAAHQPTPAQPSLAPVINVTNNMPIAELQYKLPAIPPSVVNVSVEPTPINVQASPVPVNISASPAVVNVAPAVTVLPAPVTVQAAAAAQKPGKRKITVKHDVEGNVIGADVE